MLRRALSILATYSGATFSGLTLTTEATGPPPPDAFTKALYHLNEGSGTTANDSTTGAYHLTLDVGAGWTTQANAKFGASAISFAAPRAGDDKLQRLNVPDITGIFDGTQNFTIEMFLYVDSTVGGDRGIFNTGDAAGSQISVYLLSGNTILFRRFSTTGAEANLQSTGTVPLDQWFHLALVRSGNTFYIFINGVLDVSQVNSASIRTHSAASSFIYLNNSQGDPGIVGRWDEVRLSTIARYTTGFTPPTQEF